MKWWKKDRGMKGGGSITFAPRPPPPPAVSSSSWGWPGISASTWWLGYTEQSSPPPEKQVAAAWTPPSDAVKEAEKVVVARVAAAERAGAAKVAAAEHAAEIKVAAAQRQAEAAERAAEQQVAASEKRAAAIAAQREADERVAEAQREGEEKVAEAKREAKERVAAVEKRLAEESEEVDRLSREHAAEVQKLARQAAYMRAVPAAMPQRLTVDSSMDRPEPGAEVWGRDEDSSHRVTKGAAASASTGSLTNDNDQTLLKILLSDMRLRMSGLYEHESAPPEDDTRGSGSATSGRGTDLIPALAGIGVISLVLSLVLGIYRALEHCGLTKVSVDDRVATAWPHRKGAQEPPPGQIPVDTGYTDYISSSLVHLQPHHYHLGSSYATGV